MRVLPIIRTGNNRTRPFRYVRGVRQGCPLLFNLYVNDLALSIRSVHITKLHQTQNQNNDMIMLFTYGIGKIDIIQDYTYLETRISSSGNFFEICPRDRAQYPESVKTDYPERVKAQYQAL